jgi:hypothetical protein
MVSISGHLCRSRHLFLLFFLNKKVGSCYIIKTNIHILLVAPAVPPVQETGTAGSPVPGVSVFSKTYMQRPCPKETRAIILNSFRECTMARSQKN